MDSKKAVELGARVMELQSLMIAYATDGRTSDQPRAYRELYAEVTLELEEAKYANPNPHKSLEVFFAFCKLQDMKTYASRRVYVEELYADVLLDLKRIQRHAPSSKNWGNANDDLSDELNPIRAQWLKAKNFIYSATPDFENSIKESISAVESCLMVLLNEPNGPLGKIIKQASLDSDIEPLSASLAKHTATLATKTLSAMEEPPLRLSQGPRRSSFWSSPQCPSCTSRLS